MNLNTGSSKHIDGSSIKCIGLDEEIEHINSKIAQGFESVVDGTVDMLWTKMINGTNKIPENLIN